MEIRQELCNWLLAGDAAIRWQVQRDLLDGEAAVYRAERQRVAESGWGAALLARQGVDGLWNQSAYDGKWISTTYSLYLLRLFGLPQDNEQARRGCEALLRLGLYQGREIRFGRGQTQRDLGVTALVLAICSYFDYPVDTLTPLAETLAQTQSSDGCWLPYAGEGSAAYRFETTRLALEALAEFRQRAGGAPDLVEVQARGEEFLLEHQLYLVDGQPGKKQWLVLSFPPYWFFDVLTGLEYFACWSVPDNRLAAAVAQISACQSPAGDWKLGRRHPGKTYFDMELVGEPSRWNTLRALRVLRWWE